MRIWIINHYALPPSHAGGTRHYTLAKELQNRGHEVLIIASNYNHFSHTFIVNDSIGKIDRQFDVPFCWIPTPAYSGNTLARFWNMIVFSYRILQNKYLPQKPAPDVIIGSSPHLFAAFAAARLAKKLKKTFVLEIRDLWPDSLVGLGRFTHRHPLIKVMKWMETYLYRQAAKIISLLPAVKNYLSTFGVKENSILWIPNAITLDSPELTQNNNDKFTVMYAGAHGLANDLSTVIKAASILESMGYRDKVKIRLIGDGPQKKFLQQQAVDNKLSCIEFNDPVSKNKIYEVLNEADAFLILLKKSPVFRWGISPNKLFDYLKIAKPIIFGVETPTNPVKEFNTGMSIPPENPQALADAIIKLQSLSAEERKQMGQRGYDYVKKYHHAPTLAATIEQTLLDIGVAYRLPIN